MHISKGHPHVGDVVTIRVTVRLNKNTIVPLVGPVTFRFQRPDETTFDRDAELVTDGSDGQAEYQTLAGDLDQAGEWKLQLKDGNGPWHADKETFKVLTTLPTPT